MDQVLFEYVEGLRTRHPTKQFPDFCREHSDDIRTKKYLAVLQDPGPFCKTRNNNCSIEDRVNDHCRICNKNVRVECSIENDDVTSRNQRQIIIETLEINPVEILFWNFFPYYDVTKKQKNDLHTQKTWAKELQCLIGKLTNLEVIVICGENAWKGMKFFDFTINIPIYWGPHPSGQGLNVYNRWDWLESAWTKAKSVVEGDEG